MLLFDAKPPRRADALPGGNGLAFDWQLIAGREWRLPWMLSGGLTAELLPEAVRISGATAVDVSSGVERRPGDKDPDKIRAFLEVARALVGRRMQTPTPPQPGLTSAAISASMAGALSPRR